MTAERSTAGARVYRWIESTFRLLRPEFWVVSVFPGYVGWVLARRTIAPDFDDLWSALRFNDLDEVLQWAWWHSEIAAVLIVLGPFLGGSIMVTNDFFDRKADVFNAKKTRSPLVQGTATPTRAFFLMALLVTASILVGFLIHVVFGWLMVLGQVLSFAYSAPPLRLKSRPLGDILVNAFGYGGVATVSGWVLGGGRIDHSPPSSILIVALAITSGYLPTVMMDHMPDRAAGLRTTATRFGLRASWIIGFECVVASNILMAALALSNLYVSATFLIPQTLFFVVEVWAYVVFVGSDSPRDLFVGGSITTAALFANLGAFLAAYTGLSPI